MTKGKSLRGHHLIIIERASIILIILKRRNYKMLWRSKGRRSIATDVSLSACNASYPSVHLTHLINEIVKTTTKSACIHCSCSMMALRATPVGKEEWAKVEGAEEEGGIAEVARSVVSTRGCFGRSKASLRRTELAHMAPMMVKKGEKGIGMEKC